MDPVREEKQTHIYLKMSWIAALNLALSRHPSSISADIPFGPAGRVPLLYCKIIAV